MRKMDANDARIRWFEDAYKRSDRKLDAAAAAHRERERELMTEIAAGQQRERDLEEQIRALNQQINALTLQTRENSLAHALSPPDIDNTRAQSPVCCRILL